MYWAFPKHNVKNSSTRITWCIFMKEKLYRYTLLGKRYF